MGKGGGVKGGRGAAAAAVALAGLLAACGPPPTRPEPVVAAPPQPRTITIEPGQTLLGLAREYDVPMQELAAANRLSPPYRILAGGVLVIPPAGAAPPAAAVPPAEAAPPARAGPPAAPVAVAVLPPHAVSPPPAIAKPPGATPQPTIRPAAPSPPAPSVAPVEGQPQSHLAGSQPAPRPSASPSEAAGAQPVAQPAPSAAAGAAHGAGSFAWPVRGHIVEGFGAGPEGTHNDGINIAAPRGTPVEAADAGVVAYAGNELRGYGNLLLIKHPGGWITAYAHCEAILVKPGQKVARGQVIARVGASGNVSAPQLHFELRRGNKPVDPRGYLSAAPSAPGRSG